jgi:polar amino acid transport system permease protein
LVQIVWIYYCLPIALGVNIPGVASLILAMALNSGAYLSEVFRAGIRGVDKGHLEAAWSLGFTRLQATRRVVIPQAVHEMGFARDTANRVIFIDNGVIEEEAVPSLLFTAPKKERTRSFLNRALRENP